MLSSKSGAPHLVLDVRAERSLAEEAGKQCGDDDYHTHQGDGHHKEIRVKNFQVEEPSGPANNQRGVQRDAER